MTADDFNLDWAKSDGLIPAIVQDDATEQVLMLGYMNKESLERTLQTKKVTFWSRSQGKLWMKGETSGHVLGLVSLHVDCDRDTLLIRAIPHGPTCHTGAVSCFENTVKSPVTFLTQLAALIAARHAELPEGSYTTELFKSGKARIAQKVGEEGVELALAHMVGDKEPLKGEAADLLYHMLVLLESAEVPFKDVIALLEQRHTKRK
ncbi:MAG: bifunctional phosphoribosyl-AMP cyclohydrolase/phosphoribosyl-ATP diphosphatase HisIE [Pseudobdellovibrionaceae bacterium]